MKFNRFAAQIKSQMRFLRGGILLIVFLAACQVTHPTQYSSSTTQTLPDSIFKATISPTANLLPLASATPTATQTAVLIPTSTIMPTATVTTTRTPIPFSSGPMKIGRSVLGESIEVYRFGTGKQKHLVIAGIHGGYEWNTIKLAAQLVDYLEENPNFVPKNTTLYILPSLNVDGENRGHGPIGRANDNGVDLNRNFTTGWSSDWARTGCWQLGQISAGKYPLSEPESASLARFLWTHQLATLVSYHSAGLGIFPGGIEGNSASVNLAKSLAEVSPYPYPPLDTGCEFTGMLADYASALGIAAVDIELSTHWDTEFNTNLKVLEALFNWSTLNHQQ